MKNGKSILKMVLSALFLALSYVLPFLTGQIPEIGAMLCPMHIPVLLCGFLCGWPWGLAVGAIAPIFRSLMTGGFPPLFPTAVCMAVELAVYGTVSGLMYKRLKSRRWGLMLSLLVAMLAGRCVWGVVMFAVMGFSGGSFGFGAFIAGAFTNALPGIALQIVAVPLLVIVFERVLGRKIS
jgi:riboflavin transporter FmnP